MEDERKISKFAQLLLNISLKLTQEDSSNIKLLLEVDNILTRRETAMCQNPADILRLLYSRKIIQKKHLHYLSEILGMINRKDCVKLIKEFNGPQMEKECEDDLNEYLQKVSFNFQEHWHRHWHTPQCDTDLTKLVTHQRNGSDDDKLQLEPNIEIL